MSKKNQGAFLDLCEAALDDAFNAIKADMEGVPYQSKIKWPKIKYYHLEALKDHTRYIDAGIGGFEQQIKKGQIIKTQDISIHSLDIKNFKIIKETEE